MSDAVDGWKYEEAFSRHRGLINLAEQERLRRSRIALIGCGGVGGLHLFTLGRLGIGKFTLADFDHYEVANMNRQFGARTDTLGRPKLEVMVEEIKRINPEVELRLFPDGVSESTIDDFLSGADVFLDGLDFFELGLRRRLFQRAREMRIPALTAGPIGFSTAWLVFTPDGMSFDEYFDLADGQDLVEQLVAFAVGLAPALLQRPYIDLSEVNFLERKGPSAGLACELCAGVAAAETVKILLGRGKIRPAPFYAQFDGYRCKLKAARLRGGNRHPVQRLKRWWLRRQLIGK